jgi:hypothetical protein
VTDPAPTDEQIAELAETLGISEAAAAAWLGAVAVEQNPPPGMLITV